MDLAAEWERVRDTPSDIVDHLPYMVDLVHQLNAHKVIELGVRHGTSTIAWLYGLEQTDGHLWSVDIDPAPAAFTVVNGWSHAFGPAWTFVQGSDLHPAVLDVLPRDVDIVFIDTSHHYEHTRWELETYRPFVRAGGVIVCHDTEVQWPYRAPAGDPQFPVARAIDEFAIAHGLVWTNNPACYGLATIHV